MLATVELAGFFAAHAIWCVSEGDVLVPMLAVETHGTRSLQRYLAERYEDAVGQARARLDGNPDGAARAALLFDAEIQLEWGKSDAIILQAREYGAAGFEVEIAVPYRNAAHADGFAVHRPKFLAVEAPAEADLEQLGEAFFRGVDSHDKGAEIWNAHLDASR